MTARTATPAERHKLAEEAERSASRSETIGMVKASETYALGPTARDCRTRVNATRSCVRYARAARSATDLQNHPENRRWTTATHASRAC
jgi:hypothetical protein